MYNKLYATLLLMQAFSYRKSSKMFLVSHRRGNRTRNLLMSAETLTNQYTWYSLQLFNIFFLTFSTHKTCKTFLAFSTHKTVN